MNLRSRIASIVVLGMAITSSAYASSLTYTPVNPSFGGSPLNGGWLNAQAASNNFRYLESPQAQQQALQQQKQQSGPNTAQQFQSIITSALLGQIAQQISTDILGGPGKQPLQSGSFNVGGEMIQFQQSGGNVNVTLTDPTTGGQTNISVPVPQF